MDKLKAEDAPPDKIVTVISRSRSEVTREAQTPAALAHIFSDGCEQGANFLVVG